jgi:hypothetical protein
MAKGARRRVAGQAPATDLIPVWIALVVGVHLLPVAWILGYPLIGVVAVLVTLAAMVSTANVLL